MKLPRHSGICSVMGNAPMLCQAGGVQLQAVTRTLLTAVASHPKSHGETICRQECGGQQLWLQA